MTTSTIDKSVELSMVTIFGATFNIYAVLLGAFLFFFLIAILIEQKRKRLDWLDLLTRDGTKVSTTKILQLVGGVVGTWVIIKTTITGNLTWDLFAIYLGYVASVDGFSKLVMAKYGAQGSDDSAVPYRRSNYGAYGSGYQRYRDEDDRVPSKQPRGRPTGPSVTDDVRPGAAKAGDEDDR
jgi:hypothetical protein